MVGISRSADGIDIYAGGLYAILAHISRDASYLGYGTEVKGWTKI